MSHLLNTAGTAPAEAAAWPNAERRHLRPEALAERATRCGAELTFTPRQALMIRRGASSWHCTDLHAAFTVLRDIEARTRVLSPQVEGGAA